MLISVCVATYKRPNRLRLLLEGLNELTFKKIERPEIEVILVDNDVEEVAEKICAEYKSQFQWDLKTGVETRRGITYARNKTIAMVSPNSDFVAILDDDEVPEPSWLEELLIVQREYNSGIVTGPIIPRFENSGVPDWIVKGKFFEQPRYDTGHNRPVAYTNNVLVRTEILKNLDPVFDDRFAMLGGSDCFLFLNLHKAGHTIIWADDAVVYDNIPSYRTKLKWILFRCYRVSSSYSSVEKELYPSFAVQLTRTIKGFALIGIGLVRLIPSLLIEKAAVVNSLVYISRGLGTLGGLLGIFYQEYKNRDNLKSAEK
ncbi:MAG: glycosyltransferase [Cyanobacteria bacterium P01_G01_bin.19]